MKEINLRNNINKLFTGKGSFKSIIDTLNQRPYKYIYRTLPKTIRKKIDIQADFSQQQYVADCWDVLIEKYRNNQLPLTEIKAKKILNNNKIIWQYWAQGWDFEQLPQMVKVCFLSVEKYKGDFQVIRLDNDNIHEYFDIPDFVLDKLKGSVFNPTFFSDLLRVILLHLYGGIWLDATILLTGAIPESYQKMPFFMYQRSDSVDNTQKVSWNRFNAQYFNWHEKNKVKVLNSIIFSEKGNPIIKVIYDLLLCYWKTYPVIPHYFFFQILFNQLLNSYLIEDNCPIIDDTLPHLLQRKLNSEFNLQEYQAILEKTSLHKMTYVKDIQPNSYYEYLISSFMS